MPAGSHSEEGAALSPVSTVALVTLRAQGHRGRRRDGWDSAQAGKRGCHHCGRAAAGWSELWVTGGLQVEVDLNVAGGRALVSEAAFLSRAIHSAILTECLWAGTVPLGAGRLSPRGSCLPIRFGWVFPPLSQECPAAQLPHIQLLGPSTGLLGPRTPDPACKGLTKPPSTCDSCTEGRRGKVQVRLAVSSYLLPRPHQPSKD